MDAPKMGRGRVWLDVTTTSACRRPFRRHHARRAQPDPRAAATSWRNALDFASTTERSGAFPRSAGRLRTRRLRPARSRQASQPGPFNRKGSSNGSCAASSRAPSGRSPRRPIACSGAACFPRQRAGDTLLLAGENWSRHDFAVLRRLKQGNGPADRRAAAGHDPACPSAVLRKPRLHRAVSCLCRFPRRRRRPRLRDLGLHARRLPQRGPGDRSGQGGACRTWRRDRIVRPATASCGSRRDGRAAFRAGGEHDPGAQEFRPALSALAEILDRRTRPTSRIWSSSEGKASARPTCFISCATIPAIAGTVTMLHRTSDAELAWLYAHAAFTLYPSWYEGWGLPLSESLAYGKTFIASDTSSLPEAGQGLGIHLDPYDLVSWGREVLRLTNDHRRPFGDGAAGSWPSGALRAGRTAPDRLQKRSTFRRKRRHELSARVMSARARTNCGPDRGARLHCDALRRPVVARNAWLRRPSIGPCCCRPAPGLSG